MKARGALYAMDDSLTHHNVDGEAVVAVFMPALRSIVIRSLPRVAIVALITGICAYLVMLDVSFVADVNGAKVREWVVGLGLATILWKVCYESLLQASRKYTLTSERMVATTGIFRRTTVELPLDRVQQVVLDRTLLERLTGLGTLCVTSAGSQMIDLAWVMVERPGERMAQVREALDKASVKVRLVETPSVRLVAESMTTAAREKLRRVDKEREQLERLREARGGGKTPPPSRERDTSPVGTGGGADGAKDEPSSQRAPGGRSNPMVIGLAGGIGSGKSEVAKVLAALGALVTDSDKEAKAALERPEVRAKLVEWWGPDVIGKYGTTDRKVIAQIVFERPAERVRLEALIHPLVKATRDEMIARARGAGVSAVVVDAPLLFEAGLEKECDAVMFVDTPRAERVARVRATRGWGEGELERREKAQLPLEEKKARADVVIRNTGNLDELRVQVARGYEELLGRRGSKAAQSKGNA